MFLNNLCDQLLGATPISSLALWHSTSYEMLEDYV